MRLQGSLQTVFDVLYNMGVIDPVLKMDWVKALSERYAHEHKLEAAVRIANRHQSDPEKLTYELGKLDERTLEHLAMEVAREYADFHGRTSLH